MGDSIGRFFRRNIDRPIERTARSTRNRIERRIADNITNRLNSRIGPVLDQSEQNIRAEVEARAREEVESRINERLANIDQDQERRALEGIARDQAETTLRREVGRRLGQDNSMQSGSTQNGSIEGAQDPARPTYADNPYLMNIANIIRGGQ